MESKLRHFVLIILITCFKVLLFLHIKLETQPMINFVTNNIRKFNRVAKFSVTIMNKSTVFESFKSTKTAAASVKSTSTASVVRTMKQLYFSTGKLAVFTTPFDQKKISTEIPKYDIILKFKALTGLGNRMFQYASPLGIALTKLF